MQNLLLVDDHQLIAQSISKALAPNFRVTSARNPREMREALKKDSFSIALLDLYLADDGDGLYLMPELQKASTKVIILSGTATESSLRACIKLGAHGFVDKAHNMQNLLDAIEAVNADHLAYPPQVLAQVIQESENVIPHLTERETKILNLLVNEPTPSNDSIAQALFVSPGRIKNCLTSLFEKFAVSNRHALLQEAKRRGYFTGMHPARMANKKPKK